MGGGTYRESREREMIVGFLVVVPWLTCCVYQLHMGQMVVHWVEASQQHKLNIFRTSYYLETCYTCVSYEQVSINMV